MYLYIEQLLDYPMYFYISKFNFNYFNFSLKFIFNSTKQSKKVTCTIDQYFELHLYVNTPIKTSILVLHQKELDYKSLDKKQDDYYHNIPHNFE